MKFGFYWLVFSGIILVRYFLVAGGTYLCCYLFGNQFLIKHQPSLKLPLVSRKSIKHDIQLSLLATAILAFCAASVMVSYDLGVTRLYTSWNHYGLWYLGLSFIGILILQYTCFYFVHRLFHHLLLFKHLHSGHPTYTLDIFRARPTRSTCTGAFFNSCSLYCTASFYGFSFFTLNNDLLGSSKSSWI